MRVLLAQPRGFCAGVRRAVDALTCVVENHGPPIYVYHEIVHNTRVVEQFKNHGVRFVESLDDIPEGAVLMFSAHGVSPQIREEANARNLRVIDATCPLVEKVHQEVRRYVGLGYRIVYIGHPGHDEVIGIIGEAPEHISLVSNQSQVDELGFSARSKIACLMQTTLSVDETLEMLEKLKRRFPQIEISKTGNICYATQNRQKTVQQLTAGLTAGSDVALVVGSGNSSNSRRLCELAQTRGIKAFLIDGPENIEPNWFCGTETVLITAGASAPEEIVQSCLEHLKSHFDVTVEERLICEEHVQFPLPENLEGKKRKE